MKTKSCEFLERKQFDLQNLPLTFYVQNVKELSDSLPPFNYRLIKSKFYCSEFVIGYSPNKVISQIIKNNE